MSALSDILSVEDALHELEGLAAERDEYVGALEELVTLKDGPRDENYRHRKPQAWERARHLLRRRGRILT